MVAASEDAMARQVHREIREKTHQRGTGPHA
jgi:hypothetical protein